MTTKGTENKEQVLFAYSFLRPFTGYLVLILIFIPLTVLSFLATLNVIGGLFFVVLCSLLAGSALGLFRKVHGARFFGGHFELDDGRQRRTLTYSEIEQSMKLVGIPIMKPRTQILIRIKGESKPFVIPINPYNRHLQTDLSSWLAQRISSPANNE